MIAPRTHTGAAQTLAARTSCAQIPKEFRMNMKIISFGGTLLAAALLAPSLASASLVLDTGTPTSTSGGLELTQTGWYAAQFTLTSTENISSLSAYLAPLDSTAFQFDIYSSTGFLATRVGSLTALETISANYTAPGYNTSNVNFNLGPGTYWLALEITSSAGRGGTGLDLPTAGISTSSGSAPAQAFAFYGASTEGEFAATSSGIGVQIQAAPVPLPGAAWLLGSALVGLGALRRRGARAA